MTELRWTQEVYTGSGRTSLVQSRCSCYPLFVEFAVGVTNGREMKRAPKSLWCVRLLLCAGELRSSESFPEGSQGLPFIDQENSLGVHGELRRRGKEERERPAGEGVSRGGGGGVSSYRWALLTQPSVNGMAPHIVVSAPSSASRGASSAKPWQTRWLAAPSTIS
jgi:hypothetical protein